MTDSTARAERFEPQSAASPAYLWEVSQKPVSVRIPFAVIDRLEAEAVENFRSLNSRGSEIGGILYGRTAPGEPIVVSVEDYELIACDYSRGPLYRLSDADLGRFDRAIAQHAAAGALPVAGFFRSHTRKGLALDSEDLVVMESRFQDPRKVALLVRPFATKASLAGFFFWEGKVIRGEASYLEFPFRSSDLTPMKAAGEVTDLASAGLGGPLPAPSVPKTTARAQIVPIASRREVVPVSSAPAAPPAVYPAPAAESVAAPPLAPTPTAPPPASTPAPPKAPAPVLETAPAAPPANTVKPAEAAAVAPVQPAPAVDEPPARRTVTESAEEPAETESFFRSTKFIWVVVGAVVPLLLMVALFVYPGLLRHPSHPSTATGQDGSELSLRVERTGGELQLTWNRDSYPIRSATRGVLSITDGDQHQDVPMDLVQLQKGSISYTPATSDVVFRLEVNGKSIAERAIEMVRALRTRPSPIPGVDQPATPGTPANSPAASTDDKAPDDAEPPAEEVKPERTLKPFRTDALAQRLHPPATPLTDLPDAPSIGGVSASGSSLPSLGTNAAPPPMAPPAPAKSASPLPATPVKVSTGGQIQQAVLIHRKEPEYPRLARDTGAKGVVELTATIAADGKVKKVTVLKGHPMLVKAATDAVMQWIYKPTMLNGVAVEAQTQILINFAGDR